MFCQIGDKVYRCKIGCWAWSLSNLNHIVDFAADIRTKKRIRAKNITFFLNLVEVGAVSLGLFDMNGKIGDNLVSCRVNGTFRLSPGKIRIFLTKTNVQNISEMIVNPEYKPTKLVEKWLKEKMKEE